MTARACHHIALRVQDIERAVDFYVGALGAKQLTRPFQIEGELAEQIFGGKRGLTFLMCHVGFDEGALELFQFLEPATPTRDIDPLTGNLLHWCLHVDDVPAAAQRVEQHGGRTLFPVTKWGPHDFVYCADPDGNIVELIDAQLTSVVDLAIEFFPHATPSR